MLQILQDSCIANTAMPSHCSFISQDAFGNWEEEKSGYLSDICEIHGWVVDLRTFYNAG